MLKGPKRFIPTGIRTRDLLLWKHKRWPLTLYFKTIKNDLFPPFSFTMMTIDFEFQNNKKRFLSAWQWRPLWVWLLSSVWPPWLSTVRYLFHPRISISAGIFGGQNFVQNYRQQFFLHVRIIRQNFYNDVWHHIGISILIRNKIKFSNWYVQKFCL
jgi:hypothetical protein